MLLSTAFPWIGLAAVPVLLALLAGDVLRRDLRVSRWRDVSWLSWAGVAAYLLHNVEEYGIDMAGEAYAFPKAFCAIFGYQGIYPHCPVPAAVFTAVNVPMFWLAAPPGAWMSHRRPLLGLGIYSVIAVNAMAHIGRAVASGGTYNPGLMTAVIVFLPLAGWALGGARVVTKRGRAGVLGLGVALHASLIAGMLLLLKGAVDDARLIVALQVLNAGLLLVIPAMAERWRERLIPVQRDDCGGVAP